MPKKLLVTEPVDVPIWDAVLVELGDPIPYEPAVPAFSESYRPDDEPFIDPEYFDTLLYELDLEAEQAGEEFDAVTETATHRMDEIWKWPSRFAEYRNMNEVTMQLPVVID